MFDAENNYKKVAKLAKTCQPHESDLDLREVPSLAVLRGSVCNKLSIFCHLSNEAWRG